jgi:hypothetical protein
VDLKTIPDIVAAVNDSRMKERQHAPRAHNWASDIGHACDRYLVYARTHWEDRLKPDVGLLGVFEVGDAMERAVLRWLGDAGYEITEQQMRFFDEETLLSGKCDGRLVDHKAGSWIMEIKSMSPHIFSRIHSVEDLDQGNRPWLRHYNPQMQTYLALDKSDLGVFILVNKVNGELRVIEVPYDEDVASGCFERARRINSYVARQELPDRVPLAEGVCGTCAFRHICMPDQDFGDGAEVATDEELLEVLRRREEVKSSHEEYESLDRMAKTALRGRPMVLIGEFVSTSKQVQKKAFTVKASSMWITKIERRS